MVVNQTEIDYIVRNDARNKFICNLCESLDGNTLTLFNYVDKHGKVLYNLMQDFKKPVFFVHGGVKGEDRDEIRGIVEQQDNEITIKGPAINIDSKGFFKSPKTIRQFIIDDKKDYEESLKKSVTYFLNCAKKRINFKKKLFSKSLESNEMLLKND